MMMEFAVGGDMAQLLKDYKKQQQSDELNCMINPIQLDEEMVRKYAAQVLIGIEGLHQIDVIYRDLKPENVLIDQEGYCMLTDFGLSKEGIKQAIGETNSFCGSVAYLAPEMLGQQAHGKSIDWYLLGVFIFELLTGNPPFYSQNRQQLFNNIQQAPLMIPFHLQKNTQQILKQLLNRNPNHRLGSNGSQEIKQHPYFRTIDWNAMQNRKVEMPRIKKKIKVNPKYGWDYVFEGGIKRNGDGYFHDWSYRRDQNQI